MGSTKQPIIALDLARGLAAVAVLLFHLRTTSFVAFSQLPAAQKTPLSAIGLIIMGFGHEAVMIFFVLSGFLVGGQVARHVLDGKFEIASYARDRFTRIFLPLIPACLLTVAIGRCEFGIPISWPHVIENLSGLNNVLGVTLQGNTPLWTLGYEIWFYVAAGSIGYIICAGEVHPFAALAALCATIVFFLSNPFYPLFWALGATSVFFLSFSKRGPMAAIGAALVVFGSISCEAASGTHHFLHLNLLPMTLSEFLICLGSAMTIPFLCSEPVSRALYPLRNVASWLSGFSFSLYLFHFPINWALGPLFPKTDLSPIGLALFSLRTSLVLLGVAAMYYVFEANTNALRVFMATRMTTWPRSDRQSV